MLTSVRLRMVCLGWFLLPTGCTLPLLNAAADGDTKTVVALLDEGLEVNKGLPLVGTNALILAAGHGHVETVRALLDNGADVNATDASGWTALHAAAYKGSLEVMQLLLERGAVMPRNRWILSSPLVIAEKLGHPVLVEFLKRDDSAVH